MEPRNPPGPSLSPSPPRRLLADFCALSMKILRQANRGVPKREFLSEVLEMLIHFCGCDQIRLTIEDADQSVTWQAALGSGGRFAIARCRETESVARFCRDLADGHYDPRLPCFTRAGSYWAADSERPFSYISPKDGRPREVRLETGGMRSLLLIPFLVDGCTRGTLGFRSRIPGFFREREVEFYEGLGQTLGVAIADRRAQEALRERVKELTCLYSIAQITQQPALDLAEYLRQIAGVLPPAFQHPPIAAARIRLDRFTVATSEFRESPFLLRAAIRAGGEVRGWIEVVYPAERPELEEQPFLPEEESLLEEVARRIALLVESRKAEEDRRILEEQLLHADRLATIGELAAGVAHELNEPLGNILGFAQLAQKIPGLPEQAAGDLSKIVQASLHAREIVRKLLIFARQMPTRKSPVSLNQIVGEGLCFLESRCRKEGIELVQELAPDLPEIVADPGQLYQVLVNLVVNSIQAMPQGGRLNVRTAAEPAAGKRRGVTLTVEDTGSGMSETVRRQIFLPFFTTKPVGRGTGLGLPVAHGIVTAHGGQIEVWSREGEGSRFTVRLPLEGRPAGGGRAEAAGEGAPHG